MEVGDLAKLKSTRVCLKFTKSNYNDNWVSDYKSYFLLKKDSYVLVLDKTSSTFIVLYKKFVTIIPSEDLVMANDK